MCVHVHVHICTHIYVHIYTYIYMYIYMYTWIHTYLATTKQLPPCERVRDPPEVLGWHCRGWTRRPHSLHPGFRVYCPLKYQTIYQGFPEFSGYNIASSSNTVCSPHFLCRASEFQEATTCFRPPIFSILYTKELQRRGFWLSLVGFRVVGLGTHICSVLGLWFLALRNRILRLLFVLQPPRKNTSNLLHKDQTKYRSQECLKSSPYSVY